MILEVRGVCAGYRDVDVVRDVSFQLASGEVLCLLGPNGVGKTTLFKSLLGFIPFFSLGKKPGEATAQSLMAKGGIWGAFALGFLFALALCPEPPD